MLRSSVDNGVSFSGAAWFPGKRLPEGFAVAAPPSERAVAIAKAREELLGLLHDVPEAEYELSLTDLVEKKTAGDGLACNEVALPEEELTRSSTVKERRRDSRSSSRSRSRSRSSGGVLLNMYIPSSLTRSRTSAHPVTVNCDERDRESTAIGCWSAIWVPRRGKARRQQLERTS